MASIEIANTGYSVKFLKVSTTSQISKNAGALTFCTENGYTYLYLGVGSNSDALKIAASYALNAKKVENALTFTVNAGDAAGAWDGQATKNVGYATVGAAPLNSAITGASFKNDNKTLQLIRSSGNIEVALPATAAININGNAATADNATHAAAAGKVDGEIKFIADSTPGNDYTLATSTTTANINPWNGSSKIAINYATIGAAKNDTVITAASWTTRAPTLTNGVISAGSGNNANAATITLTRGNGSLNDLTVNVPINLPINITGQAGSVFNNLTFPAYDSANSTNATLVYNGSASREIDISRNVVIAPFELSTTSTKLTITSKDIHTDSVVSSVIITSGAENMTSAFSYNDTISVSGDNGTLTMSCTAPAGAVSGYIVIVRGTKLSKVTGAAS